MLTEKQNLEIKEHLERAQNPLFMFDNDQDGLCSFLLLQRYIGRGKGVAVKTFPKLDVGLFRRVLELEADYIFILDKPNVDPLFFEEARKVNLPIVWIDHHATDTEVPEWVNYYNSFYDGDKKGESVTHLCYDITKRKEDMWLAVAGCIADSFMPEYYKDFLKEYPELGKETERPFEVLYATQLGKFIRLLGAGLMDKTSNVVLMMKLLMKAKSPYDILDENPKNEFMYTRFNFLEKRRAKLVTKAMRDGEQGDNYLYFEYSGDTSMSAALANELVYRFPDKYLCVVYVSGIKANISTRGPGVKDKVVAAVKGIKDATGGGHVNAAGGQVNVGDLPEFKKKFLSSL